YGRAQAAALHFAQVYRFGNVAPGEGPGEIRAAGDRTDPDVGANVLINPAIRLRRERRAGGADAPQARQVGLLVGFDAGLFAGGIEGRAGAEYRAACRTGKSP